jgi:putative YhbY family RNA-binding protein
MRTLTPVERRTLRAKAHALHPFVIVGHQGLTAAVLHEIDVNLDAHELIKIRVLGDERDEREALLARICAELDAAPVQHLGKILTIWRPPPEPPAAAPKSRARLKSPGSGLPRSRPRNSERRTRGERDEFSTSRPKSALRSPESSKRKQGSRGTAATSLIGNSRRRRRKPPARDDAITPFAAAPTARRRRTKR